MKQIILLIAILFLCGCATTYHATTSNPATGETSILDVSTYREYKDGIEVYVDENNGIFHFRAGSITNDNIDWRPVPEKKEE